MDYEENRKELANRMVDIEFHPIDSELAIRSDNSISFPIGDLAAYSGAATSVLPALKGILESVQQTSAGEQLYRCVFPNGVSGALAQKDGASLGAIMNGNRIAGQARWVPVGGAAAGAGVATIAPAIIFITAMTVQINKKLTHLQKTADEILGFLEQDKQSHMKADLKILAEIMDGYRQNWENESFIHAKLVQTDSIKRESLANIDFYKAKAAQKAEGRELIHFNFASNKFNDVQNLFGSYRSAVYLYSYSSFAELLLMGDYRESAINSVKNKLEECESRYREFYSKCFDELRESADTGFDNLAVRGVASATGLLGSVIGSIPVIRKGPIDEALESASDFLKNTSKESVEKMLDEFRQNESTDSDVFINNVELIGSCFNKPATLITDGHTITVQID